MPVIGGFVIAASTRLGRRTVDLRMVQRATASIAELTAGLDRKLEQEQRPAERLRMLRDTTNQITRIANDAIQAYRRASTAVRAELERPKGDRMEAQQMRLALDAARAEVLATLEVASRRYTWAEPWPGSDGVSTNLDEKGDQQP
jgi:hypothetical protein